MKRLFFMAMIMTLSFDLLAQEMFKFQDNKGGWVYTDKRSKQDNVLTKHYDNGTNDDGKKHLVIKNIDRNFFTDVYIDGFNGSLPAQIDTGASYFTIPLSLAQSMRLSLLESEKTTTTTANGVVDQWLVYLPKVRVGNLVVSNVRAAVINSNLPYVLVGLSLLEKLDVSMTASTMVLSEK